MTHLPRLMIQRKTKSWKDEVGQWKHESVTSETGLYHNSRVIMWSSRTSYPRNRGPPISQHATLLFCCANIAVKQRQNLWSIISGWLGCLRLVGWTNFKQVCIIIFIIKQRQRRLLRHFVWALFRHDSLWRLSWWHSCLWWRLHNATITRKQQHANVCILSFPTHRKQLPFSGSLPFVPHIWFNKKSMSKQHYCDMTNHAKKTPNQQYKSHDVL